MRRCVYCTLKGRSRKETSTYCTHCRVQEELFSWIRKRPPYSSSGRSTQVVVAFSHFNVLIIAHSLREKRTNGTVKSDERDKEAVDLLEKEREKRARHMEEEDGSPLTRARTDRSALSQVTIHPLSDQWLAAWRNHCNEDAIICLKKHQLSDEEVALAVPLLQRRRMAMERESTQKSKLHLSPNAVLNNWWLWQKWTYGILPV